MAKLEKYRHGSLHGVRNEKEMIEGARYKGRESSFCFIWINVISLIWSQSCQFKCIKAEPYCECT